MLYTQCYRTNMINIQGNNLPKCRSLLPFVVVTYLKYQGKFNKSNLSIFAKFLNANHYHRLDRMLVFWQRMRDEKEKRRMYMWSAERKRTTTTKFQSSINLNPATTLLCLTCLNLHGEMINLCHKENYQEIGITNLS